MRIAVSGKMGVGKSTVANHLVQEYGYKCKALAGVLKELEVIHAYHEPELWYCAVYPIGEELATTSDLDVEDITSSIIECFNDNIPMPGEKNRRLLQLLGTDVLRKSCGDDIWANHLVKHHGGHLHLVVDDLRFRNELIVLREAGFLCIRVEMNENTRLMRLENLYGPLDPQKLVHISEVDLDRSMDMFDHIVYNDGTIEELLNVIDKIIYRRALVDTRRVEQA